MSRIPHRSSTPVKTRTGLGSEANSAPRARTKSSAKPSIQSPARKTEAEPLPTAPSVSIREAIALKRAEAKKALSKSPGSGLDNFTSLEDALPVATNKQEDEDILGRWSIREAIERAKTTGSFNISTRSLSCIPSALFEIHLGISPDKLKSVPDEPPLPPSDTSAAPRRGARKDAPAWFEAVDLQVLKAWNNDIIEIQHEISLFGSLKTIDLHQNKITTLPESFADLTALVTLDLSHNALTSLPSNIFALPELTNLNISNNKLTSLPFNAPFSSGTHRSRQSNLGGGSFFTPTISRASTPLPRLVIFDASHNQISARSINLIIPTSLLKLDLSHNPLGADGADCHALVKALGALDKLKELRFEYADIGDDSFPSDLFLSRAPFPKLRLLDLGETRVTVEAVKSALKTIKQTVTFDMVAEDPSEGVTRVLVGKKVIREAWELEAERRAKAKVVKQAELHEEVDDPFTIGLTSRQNTNAKVERTKTEVVKEAWEIEAEQGLLTEGGKRRARAAAAVAANTKPAPSLGLGAPSAAINDSSSLGFSLENPQYYARTTETLTLPASTPPPKTFGHSRTFSLASPSPSSSSLASGSPRSTTDIALPTPTLPLAVISTQPFAQTLKILILKNRRMDRSFTLPPPSTRENGQGLLPNLEELSLEGCGLSDSVLVSRDLASGGSSMPPRTNESLLPLLASLFPSLRTLDLSYNALTSASLSPETLSLLFLSSQTPHRKGLKHLRLRGNRLGELDALQEVAKMFKGNRDVPEWSLDELDLRDNEIGKIPPELGLLPLDVFLVDGNIFRVPQRRIWEREGTKGLLTWLRLRIE